MNICTHICKYSCLFMFTLNYYHFKFTVLLPMFSHNDRATNTPHSPMDCQLNMSIKRMLLLKNMYTYTSSSSFYVAVHLCQVHGHFTYVFTQRQGYKHTTQPHGLSIKYVYQENAIIEKYVYIYLFKFFLCCCPPMSSSRSFYLCFHTTEGLQTHNSSP